FGKDASSTWVFFGKYLEVIPNERLVWTNEEEVDGAVTTVTFAEEDGKTRLVLRDLYPSKDALEEGSGSESGLEEQFEQLDEVLVALGASSGQS
ncbi:MAG: SRPBCC domain-containing protein, partial [Devosia sp.]